MNDGVALAFGNYIGGDGTSSRPLKGYNNEMEFIAKATGGGDGGGSKPEKIAIVPILDENGNALLLDQIDKLRVFQDVNIRLTKYKFFEDQ
jgi:hypothetical protein